MKSCFDFPFLEDVQQGRIIVPSGRKEGRQIIDGFIMQLPTLMLEKMQMLVRKNWFNACFDSDVATISEMRPVEASVGKKTPRPFSRR
jgi:hypothetical protein